MAMKAFLLLVPFLVGCGSNSVPNVSCLIFNLDYMDCTWSSAMFNYSFKSRLGSRGPYLDCAEYLQEDLLNSGCRLPFKTEDKFKKLFTILSFGDGETNEQTIELKPLVKLNPPHNLSLVADLHNKELWFYWNISKGSNCAQSSVQYKSDNSEWETIVTTNNFYTLPQISLKSLYEFQVRTRVSDACGLSKFWSDWSSSVFWYPTEKSNTTDPSHKFSNSWVTYPFVVTIALIVLVIFLLLVRHERLRVILIPVVPNLGKTLEELLKTHNGNVEDWLHIPKEFKEGFEHDFSELACPVRECHPFSQVSPPNLTVSCSTSDLPPPPPYTPPGLV